MRHIPGAWVDQLDDLDDPEAKYGRRIQQRTFGSDENRQLLDIDAFVMRDDSLLITCSAAGDLGDKMAHIVKTDGAGRWQVQVAPKWKERILELLAFGGSMPVYDRGPLLLHLLEERFQMSENAAAAIEAWLLDNHIPYEWTGGLPEDRSDLGL